MVEVLLLATRDDPWRSSWRSRGAGDGAHDGRASRSSRPRKRPQSAGEELDDVSPPRLARARTRRLRQSLDREGADDRDHGYGVANATSRPGHPDRDWRESILALELADWDGERNLSRLPQKQEERDLALRLLGSPSGTPSPRRDPAMAARQTQALEASSRRTPVSCTARNPPALRALAADATASSRPHGDSPRSLEAGPSGELRERRRILDAKFLGSRTGLVG